MVPYVSGLPRPPPGPRLVKATTDLRVSQWLGEAVAPGQALDLFCLSFHVRRGKRGVAQIRNYDLFIVSSQLLG